MDMDSLLGVGFGDVTVTKDGEHVWSENLAEKDADGNEQLWQGSDAEAAAIKEPDHDWRVHFMAPLYEAEYQRQGRGHWPLISKGPGFA
jgi:hypothetical protein